MFHETKFTATFFSESELDLMYDERMEDLYYTEHSETRALLLAVLAVISILRSIKDDQAYSVSA